MIYEYYVWNVYLKFASNLSFFQILFFQSLCVHSRCTLTIIVWKSNNLKNAWDLNWVCTFCIFSLISHDAARIHGMCGMWTCDFPPKVRQFFILSSSLFMFSSNIGVISESGHCQCSETDAINFNFIEHNSCTNKDYYCDAFGNIFFHFYSIFSLSPSLWNE